MVDWTNPSIVELHGEVFSFVATALLGLYGWETICGLKRDFELIRSFTFGRTILSRLLYFLCRYSTLVSLIGINVTNHSTTQIACQSWYMNNQVWGNIAIGSSSTLLLHRTIAIWNSRGWKAILPLCVLSLGQWSVLLYAVSTVESKWDTNLNSCVITSTNSIPLTAVYVVTMAVDFIVLVLASIGLFEGYHNRESILWTILFRDGIIYFVVAFTSNLVATTFIALNLNPVMGVLFAVPACIFSAIVACRSVVHLMDFKMARTGNQNAHWDSTTGDSSDPGHIGSRDRKKKKVKALESQDLALPVARTIPHGSGGRSTSLSGVDISLQRYEHRCDAGITTSVKSIPSDQPARSIASASRGMIFAPRGKLDDIEVGPASYAEDMEVIELSNPTDSKTSVDNGTVTANSVKMSLGILPSWLRSTLSLSN